MTEVTKYGVSKKYLLFDLDGTLTDPKIGICTCVQYALASFGIDESDLDKLEPFIGPPLKDSFIRYYQFTEEQAEEAVAKYRERFSDVGLFENEIYRGVAPLLRELKAAGFVLAVASSKPTVYVQRILEHFKIDRYFRAVVGSELDGTRVNKDEVVKEALRRLFGDKEVRREQVYMIGDRCFDVEGARRMGVESVGVTYGYGSMEELKEAKADYIVRSVEELRDLLLRETEDTAEAQTGFRKVWPLLFPFLLFFFARNIVMQMVQILLLAFCDAGLGVGTLVLVSPAGEPSALTGNAATLMSGIGFLAGAAVVYDSAGKGIAAAQRDMRLLHLRREPGTSCLLMAAVVAGTALGLNLLLESVGFSESSAAYQAVAENQYAAFFPLGLFVYGIIAPAAEELLFRGILYGRLRRMLSRLPAMGVASALFGVYHGNAVQGVYAFLMGFVIVYAYEYFGDFRAAVGAHMLANILVYCISYADFSISGSGWQAACAVSLICAAGGFFLLNRRRRVF